MADSGTRWRLPAEWEPHEATWIAWPHNVDTWPGVFDHIPAAFARLVATLRRFEEVRIIVPDGTTRKAVERRGDLGQGYPVRFIEIPTDDAWIRDFAPLFVEAGAERIVAKCHRFDAWGRKYAPWERDASAGARIAQSEGLEAEVIDFVLEGGSIDVDGLGTLLTTETCLLHSGRNPGTSQEEVESHLRRHFGARSIIWLGGELEGDDTDGHIDNLARFVDERTVVVAVAEDPRHPAHQPLAENLRRLERSRDASGRSLRIVPLPLPETVSHRGAPLPASYANFLIVNGGVLVPQFGQAADARALEILGSLFPSRDVLGVPSRHLVVGQGAIHCLTMQQPRRAR